MITCKAKSCNSVQNKDPNVTFHKFPLFDPKLLKSWLENIAAPYYQPKLEDHVCSLHFTDDQFMKSEPRRLIRYAIPSIIVDVLPNINSAYSRNLLKGPGGQTKQRTVKRKAVTKQDEDSSDSDVSTSDVSSAASDDASESEHTVTGTKMEPEKKKTNIQTPRYVGDLKEEDLQCPEKMKTMWNIAYKEIKEQRNKLYSITQRNKRLEGQVTRLKNVIRHLKSVHK